MNVGLLKIKTPQWNSVHKRCYSSDYTHDYNLEVETAVEVLIVFFQNESVFNIAIIQKFNRCRSLSSS